MTLKKRLNQLHIILNIEKKGRNLFDKLFNKNGINEK